MKLTGRIATKFGTFGIRRSGALATLAVAISALAFTAAPVSADEIPTATMGTISAVDYTGVHLTGTVNPFERLIYYGFEYSTDQVNWTRGPHAYYGGNPTVAANSGPTEVEEDLTGLKGGTEYFVRLGAYDEVEPEHFSAAPNPSFTTLAVAAPTVSIDPVTAITGATAHLSGSIDTNAPVGNPAAFDVNWEFQCTPECPGLAGGTVSADSSGASHTVEATATGLHPNTPYEVSLVSSNAGGSLSAGPKAFTTLAVEPEATTIPAFALAGGTTALLGGEVNPRHSATTYWFEYGTDESYGASLPLSQDADAGSGEETKFVAEELSGLTPSTTYHFRVVASNSAGTIGGEDKTFTTALAGTESSIGRGLLPDGRVWEMVSPPEKNNSDIFRGYAVASASGDAVAFKSQGSFAGQPTSRAGLVSDYLARRGASGWSTEGITPPNGNLLLSAGYYAFSEDLTVGFLSQNDKPGSPGLDPEHESDQVPSPDHSNWYLRNNDSGGYTLVTPILPGNFYTSLFHGGSADLSHILIQSERELTPGAPCQLSNPDDGSNSYPACAYEYADGSLRLASVLPGEVPSIGTANAMAKDGSRIYFSTNEHLYVRTNGSSTAQVDVSERTLPPSVPSGSLSFQKIGGPHGEKALFTTTEDLVDADENSSADLYLYDGTKPAGSRLTLISKGDLAGTSAQTLRMELASEDLSRVYFATTNQLLSGQPSVPGNYIYLWEDDGGQGSIRPVAIASSGDLLTNASNGFNQPVSISVSPDGQYLAFVSQARLTAYDNAGKNEVYRYDSANGRLVCVSCDPQGDPPTTAATLEDYGEGNPTEHKLRNVTDQGQVFFQSLEPLVARDSNGQRDVYEYENGAPHLISTGAGAANSWFVDASVSGDDVFFATRDRLVGWDRDNNYDVYDARVNGGLPEPPPAVVGCDGDACQPAPVPPNDPTPASANFNGAGNVTQSASHHKKRHQRKKKGRKHHRSASKRHGSNATQKRG